MRPKPVVFALDRHPLPESIDPTRRYCLDIMDGPGLSRAIAEVQPEVVANLSSFSSVRDSWLDPVACHNINYLGTLNLCAALAETVPGAKLLHVSSLEVYGGDDAPRRSYREKDPINPLSPYAVSKAASELIVRQYGVSHGLRYVIVRPSNHTGPGRSERFVLSGWAKQLVEIRRGLRPPVINVGNLDVERGFMDVRDVAKVYARLLLREPPTGCILNVCPDRSSPLGEILTDLIDMAGVNVTVEPLTSSLRPVDRRYLHGSNRNLAMLTGWKAHIPLERTLRDLLSYWEEKLRAGAETRLSREGVGSD